MKVGFKGVYIARKCFLMVSLTAGDGIDNNTGTGKATPQVEIGI